MGSICCSLCSFPPCFCGYDLGRTNNISEPTSKFGFSNIYSCKITLNMIIVNMMFFTVIVILKKHYNYDQSNLLQTDGKSSYETQAIYFHQSNLLQILISPFCYKQMGNLLNTSNLFSSQRISRTR
jgi:hypothetical protein